MLTGLLRKSLSQTVSMETIDSTKSQQADFNNSPYHSYISTVHDVYPHLRSLSLYTQAIEKSRIDGQLGSHDSDSILAAEISTTGDVTYTRIDCYEADDVALHHDILSGKGDKQAVSARILVIEDLSPGAIEVLGTGFHLDPHVFYFHLAFDTRRSAMVDLVDAVHENNIPVTWCMPSHAPDNFISVPVPCDLKPLKTRKLEGGLREDSTYSRQAYQPIAQISGKEQEWEPPRRAFHRLSLIFAEAEIETTIILAFPTWKRLSQRQSGISQWPLMGVLDSYGYDLIPHATSLDTTSSPDHSSKRGVWCEGQWERVRPLFQFLVHGLPSSAYDERVIRQGFTRERSLLWLYSKMSQNYYLACQNEGRCWRDIRAILDTEHAIGHVSQRPKRQFRDSMTKTIELLEIAKDWLERSLGDPKDQETFRKLQRRVEVTLSYEKARIAQVLLNINDHQSEVQMDLMVLQLEENRHAIEQAVSVGRLTKLAFLFVPLGTVCSAFGMNLREMDKHPTIWWFMGTSVLCTVAATAISSTLIRRVVEKTRGNPVQIEAGNK